MVAYMRGLSVFYKLVYINYTTPLYNEGGSNLAALYSEIIFGLIPKNPCHIYYDFAYRIFLKANVIYCNALKKVLQ